MTAPWEETTLPTILARYELKDIFNADEFGLFYEALPSKCFKHVRNLPCRYRSQKKAWMNGTLFEEWLRELDRKFEMQGRKIVMIVDNCPAHPEVSGLKTIHLQFLPPNTTSCTQPMDQGVIRYVYFIIFYYF